MSEDLARQQTHDYYDEVKAEVPSIVEPVMKDSAQLLVALDKLLTWEKKTRLAADDKSTRYVALEILGVIRHCNEWKSLNDHISLLCKRRAQLKNVVQEVIRKGVEFVEQTPDKPTKYDLIETLREVSQGKIFVELERARLTRTLAMMKEAEGKVSEAADILQEVQVETVGSMEKKEKAEFLLEQIRLTLDKHDYIRSSLISQKVSTKVLEEADFQELKIKFYQLMIRYYIHESDYLQICKSYFAIYNTPVVQADPVQWKRALKLASIYLMLSNHSPEQFDMMQRFKLDKKISEIPSVESALLLFTTHEIIARPIPQEAEWKLEPEFNGEHGETAFATLHKRVNQHNVRVISRYYTKIHLARMANLLTLDVDTTERYISDMVSDKEVQAKIDRPAGIVVFQKEVSKNADTLLNDWAGSISGLLNLVETTCHLINKENMMHDMQ